MIVVVKSVSESADNEAVKALISEPKVMAGLNIVNLLEAVTKNIMERKLMLINEFYCYGDLQNFFEFINLNLHVVPRRICFMAIFDS